MSSKLNVSYCSNLVHLLDAILPPVRRKPFAKQLTLFQGAQFQGVKEVWALGLVGLVGGQRHGNIAYRYQSNLTRFIDAGGTLSHHHAVGVEHAAWLEQDISPVGVMMIRSLLDGVDPGHNLNPGKIVPAD
jgi:hypothetical protein